MKHKLIRNFWKFHREGKQHIRRRPFIIPISGLILGVAIVLVALLSHNPLTLAPATGNHVVFLFDNSKRQVLDTRAKTVGELLSKVQLNLIPEDVVEPSRDTPIVEDNFRINIYRARPVVVVDDNSQKIVTLTAQRSPRVVAQNAGISLYPEDNVSFAQGSLSENIIGEKVVIDRATPVNFVLYGTPLDVHTHAKTVADLLKERKVKLTKDDTVQPAVSTPISSGIQISVVRNGTVVTTVEEAIPTPVQYVDDASLSFGTSVVRQAGSPGKQIVTYQVVTENGQEKSRTVIQQVVVTQPVPQIVARGKTVAINGDKTAVMAAAGISSGDYGYVNYVVSHESNWNPSAQNASGCLGLGQACPGSKLTAACPNLDAVCQLRYFSGYASGRYGSWGGAYRFWTSHGYW